MTIVASDFFIFELKKVTVMYIIVKLLITQYIYIYIYIYIYTTVIYFVLGKHCTSIKDVKFIDISV